MSGARRAATVAGVLAAALALALTAFAGSQAGGIALRVVSVAACNGEIQAFPFKYKGPSHTKVRVTAADAERLVAFNAVMLAPRGWHCDLIGGSGGEMLEAYNAAAGFIPFEPGTYQPQEAVSTSFVTTGTHALEVACPYFPLAARELKQAGVACPYTVSTPIGESRTHPNSHELDYADAPGSFYGTGDPSGGRYKAVGVVLFESSSDKKNGKIENASTATCTLAPARRHLCAAILRQVRAEFQRTVKNTR